MQRLIHFSLHNRLLMALLGAFVAAAGWWSYRGLPVDAFPDVSPNLVQIFTVTEGLAPEEVERYITYPVETAMTGLPGVEKVRSVSNFGLSVVNVYFQDGMDIYFCRQLVNERLQEASEKIPPGFGQPELGPISTGMGLVLYYYLHDTENRHSLEELRTIHDWIVKFHLQTVPGVTEVLGIGGYERQYHVRIHPDDLLRYDLTLQTIVERIEANNLNVGAQFIEKNSEEFVVRSVGLAAGIDDLNLIVLKSEGGRPIYLRDVADVEIGGAIRRGVMTRNGEQEIVSGMVVKLFGENASTVIDRVERKIEEVNRILPEGIHIVPFYQQKELVAASVKTVRDALLLGVLLVTLVLFVFMGGLRPSVVVASSIPFSVLFACVAMGQLNISANLMSLGGLAIAIGLLVDGSIVMVENMDRLLRDAHAGESRIHLVGRACNEVIRPITFAIMIIVLVFLPLFTLQGVEGKTFRPLAYTVAWAMLGSLIFAVFVVPAFGSAIMRRPRNQNEGNGEAQQHLVIRLLTRPYLPALEFLLRRRWVAVLMAALLLALGAIAFPRLGTEFTPRLNEGTIAINLTMAPSISLTESTRLTMIVERRLLEIPEVDEVFSRIGRGEVGAHADPINTAHMFVTLKPKSAWLEARNQADIEAAIRRKTENLPGIAVSLTQPIEMTVDELLEGVRAELAVKLFGDDLTLLKEKAEEIAAALRAVRGAADVAVDQVAGVPQLLIRPDREAVARYGINIADVQDVIRTAVGGRMAGQIFEDVRRFDIVVRFTPEARESESAIREILIHAPDGRRIPLDELADVSEIVGPRQITREDNQRYISVQCNVVGRDVGSFVAEAQNAIDQVVDLPPGYLVSWGGQFRLQQEANRRLAVVVPVTLLAIALLLFIHFGSVKNALLILLNIPLALVGGVLALWISGQNLSVPASVGFIALFGIALENGMVLVSYINQLVRDGLPWREACLRGACLRIRSVLMTALTTALGLIPLLLATGTGSEVQRPLATVVVGGLITSTMLTLLVIPGLYKWFSDVPCEG